MHAMSKALSLYRHLDGWMGNETVLRTGGRTYTGLYADLQACTVKTSRSCSEIGTQNSNNNFVSNIQMEIYSINS